MKREGSDSEMPFASIFGGLHNELLPNRVKREEIASTPMKTIKSAVNRAFEEGSNEDLSKLDQFTKILTALTK